MCRHACHQLLPWLRASSAMVPHGAWPGSDQWPWSTPPATGPVGRLGRPNASNPGGVDRYVLSLCCPRCMCVCSVLAHLAPVYQCARCLWFVCAVGGCVPPPQPPPSNFLYFFFCSVFALFCLAFLLMGKGARAHCRHRHGELLQRCNSVVFSCVRCRCFVGGRAPGMRLARLDVHEYASGWVWLVTSLLLVLTA